MSDNDQWLKDITGSNPNAGNAAALLTQLQDIKAYNPNLAPPPVLNIPGPGADDIAKRILLNADVTFNDTGSVPKQLEAEHKSPNIGQRVLDILSRTNYATAEATKRVIDPGGNLVTDIAGGLWGGISGHNKTHFSDVIKDARKQGLIPTPADPKVADRQAGGIGLGFDIGADPLTYTGVGPLVKLFKAMGLGGKAAKAAEAAEKVTPIIGKDMLHETGAFAHGIKDAPETQLPLFSAPKSAVAKPAPAAPKPAPVISKGQQVIPGMEKLTSPPQQLSMFDLPRTPVQAAEEVAEGAVKQVPKGQMTLYGMGPRSKLMRPPVKGITPGEVGKAVSDAPVTSTSKVIKEAAESPVSKLIDNLPDAIAKGAPPVAATDIVDAVAKGHPGITDLLAPKHPVEAMNPHYLPKVSDEIAERSRAFAEGKYDWGPKTQVNIYNRMRDHVRDEFKTTHPNIKFPASTEWDHLANSRALSMVRHVEDGLIHAGHIPSTSGELANGVRISDWIKELGVRKVTDKVLQQMAGDKGPVDMDVLNALNAVRAKAAINDGMKAQPAVDSALQVGEHINAQGFSPAREAVAHEAVASSAGKVARQLGASPQGAKAAAEIIRDIQIKNQVIKLPSKTAAMLDDAVKTGKPAGAAAAEGTVRNISKITGMELPKGAMDAERWIGAHFMTSYGMKDVRPVMMDHLQSAKASTAARNKYWTNIFRGFTDEEIREGFKLTDNLNKLPAGSDRIKAASDEFTKRMESLFGSAGLSDKAQKGMTVVSREGITMEEMNHLLDRFGVKEEIFRFNNKKYVDKNGIHRDYSAPGDWTKSWTTAKPTDPLDFMHRVETAMDYKVRQNAFWTQLGYRFGSRVRKTGYTATIDIPRLKGYYFPPSMAEQLKVAQGFMSKKEWQASGFVAHWESVTNALKSGLTIYNPSHHVNNGVGDAYFAWLDGVNTVRPYRLGGKALSAHSEFYKDIDNLEHMVAPGAIQQAMSKPVAKQDVLFKNKAGVPFSAEQIYTAAFNHGLLAQAHAIEDIGGKTLTKQLAKVSPARGKIGDFARGMSEAREHYVIMGHFVDKVMKSNTKDFDAIFSEAAHRVRKWHPNGMDLTEDERKLKLIVPFYSWTRKALPLIMESMYMKPGKVMAYPKLMHALQVAQGTEGPNGSPFPTDQPFVDFLSSSPFGPIAKPGGFMDYLTDPRGNLQQPGHMPSVHDPITPDMFARKEPSGDIVSQNHYIPTWDTMQSTTTNEGLIGSLHPLLRAPMDLAAGKDIRTGMPMEGNKMDYITSLIPPVAKSKSIFNFNPATMQSTAKAQTEGHLNPGQLLNWITGAGLTNSGQYEDKAMFEERARQANIRKQLIKKQQQGQ